MDAFPKARLLVRLDGGFACPEMLEFLEAVEWTNVVAMARKRRTGADGREADEKGAAAVAGVFETEHVYGECRYAAKSWEKKRRRIIIKAEVVRLDGREPKDNQRFVITNLPDTPKRVYEDIYCQRGDVENRIKNCITVLRSTERVARGSWANQLRG